MFDECVGVRVLVCELFACLVVSLWCVFYVVVWGRVVGGREEGRGGEMRQKRKKKKNSIVFHIF